MEGHTQKLSACVCVRAKSSYVEWRSCVERERRAIFFTSNQRWCHPENQKRTFPTILGLAHRGRIV